MAKPDKRLLTPGPTPVPPAALEAGTRPMISHRSDEFKSLYGEIQRGLQWAFQTENDVLIFTSSGTGAMEAAVANALSPGDTLLVLANGVFGRRFAHIAAAFGIRHETLEFNDGCAIDADRVAARLAADKQRSIKAVAFQHNETSTGVLNPACDIANAVARHGALTMVDAISGLLSAPLPVDQWKLDIVIGGSQKAFMAPPGLSFVCLSERAFDAIKQSRSPRFYFDLLAAREQHRRSQTPYTPAISLLFTLQKSLQLLQAEGLDACIRRHERAKRAVRSAIRLLGLPLFVNDDSIASNALTAVCGTPELAVDTLRLQLRERHGITVSGGQEALAGKIMRIGHLGHITTADLAECLRAIETCLAANGHALKQPGAAVAAAAAILAETQHAH